MRNERVTPIIEINKIHDMLNDVQDRIDEEDYQSAIALLENLRLSMQSIIEKLNNWRDRKEKLNRIGGPRTKVIYQDFE